MAFTLERLTRKNTLIAAAVSDYYPAHNPHQIKFIRKDNVIVSLADDGSGLTRVEIFSAFAVTLGGQVYINTVLYTGTQEGVYTVTNIVDSTHFDIDAPFAANEAGHINFNTDRKNYRFEIKVRKANLFTLTYEEIGTQPEYPFSNGIIITDVSRLLRRCVVSKNEFAYNLINEADLNASSGFVIQAREVYDGTDPAFSHDSPGWVTNSALQITSPVGANMAMFMPEPTFQDKAKFLTAFTEQVTMWKNLPFDLQFIFGNLVGDDIPSSFSKLQRHESLPDQNIDIYDDLDTAQKTYINRMLLDFSNIMPNGRFDTLDGWSVTGPWNAVGGEAVCAGSSGALIWDFGTDEQREISIDVTAMSGTQNVIIRIATAGGATIVQDIPVAAPGTYTFSGVCGRIHISVVDFPPFGDASIAFDNVVVEIHRDILVQVSVDAKPTGTGDPDAIPITEVKPVLVIDQIPCNPIYLVWLNPNGGWDYWCFSIQQTEGIDIKDGETFSEFIDELTQGSGWPEISNAVERPITKNAVPSIKVNQAYLTANQIAGLRTLLTSPVVFMLYNPFTWQDEDIQWLPVRIEAGKYQLSKTNKQFSKLQCTILLPKLNIQDI